MSDATRALLAKSKRWSLALANKLPGETSELVEGLTERVEALQAGLALAEATIEHLDRALQRYAPNNAPGLQADLRIILAAYATTNAINELRADALEEAGNDIARFLLRNPMPDINNAAHVRAAHRIEVADELFARAAEYRNTKEAGL